MSLSWIFNHHSLPFENQGSAEQGVIEFVKISSNLERSYGYKLILIDEAMDSSWYSIELSRGYFWRDWFDWIKQQEQLKDVLRVFKSLQTRQPLFLPEERSEVELLVEVRLLGMSENLSALRAAYHYENFLVSFDSNLDWKAPQLNVLVTELKEDIDESTDQLRNIYSIASIEFHRDYLDELKASRLASGAEILLNQLDYFPNIVLLDQAKSQLRGWSNRADILPKVRDALGVLDEFQREWQGGGFVDYQHQYLRDLGLASEVSGESTTVSNSSRLKAFRTFWLPTGREVYCENHIKLPNYFRLYFYPCQHERVIYVAYIGGHLPL